MANMNMWKTRQNSEFDLLISAYNKGCFRLAIILLATVILGAIQLFI